MGDMKSLEIVPSDSNDFSHFSYNKILDKMISPNRLLSFAWYQCGHCSVIGLRLPKEAYCCQEPAADTLISQKVLAKIRDFQCVTLNPDFAKYCLDPEVYMQENFLTLRGKL